LAKTKHVKRDPAGMIIVAQLLLDISDAKLGQKTTVSAENVGWEWVCSPEFH